MSIEYKTVEATIKQAGDEGSFEAAIATLGVIDHDGDIVEHGAFGDVTVPVLPSHQKNSVPLGKAQIVERGNEAIAVGRFNLDIPAGRDWHNALKFDLENPPAVQEWSYGFLLLKPDGVARDTVNGQSVRRLIKIKTLEVSPVLKAASIGTGTISAKELDAEKDPPKLAEQIKLTMAGVETLVARIREVSEGRKERGRKLGKDVSVEALALAEGCHELDRALQQLKDMAEGMLPDEAIAKAAARFLAHDTLRHRVIS